MTLHSARGGRRVPLGAVAVCLLAAFTAAADATVPVAFQATIVVKALAYDRALRDRAGDDLLVAVLFKESDRADAKLASEVRDAFGSLQTPVQGLPLKVASRPYRDAAALAEWIAADKIDLLYITPGLSSDLPAIKGVTAKAKVVTVSAARGLVEGGLAMGVVIGPDARPRVLVNLPVAESAGMKLDSKLLQLAEVIR